MQFKSSEIETGRKFFAGNAIYFTSATNKDNLPKSEFNEIAFIGRSNVGKSSIINALTNRKKLANFSKTPGRTRQLNFFKIENKEQQLILVDLPGYGYAKVTKKDIQNWYKLTNFYFYERVNLRTVCLLVDARRDVSKDDKSMINFLDKIGLSWTLILTKVDKLKQNDLLKKKSDMKEIINKSSAAFPFIFMTSSIKKIGFEDLRAYISSFSIN